MSLQQRERSIAMTGEVDQVLRSHLLKKFRQEDLCFATWAPSEGRDRSSALLRSILLPEPHERQLHGNVSLIPGFFERALGTALARGEGLAFLHSHVGPGWQAMSPDDAEVEHSMAGAVQSATGFPLVGMTLGTDGAWSGRSWLKSAPGTYFPVWSTNVRAVGDHLGVTFADHLRKIPRAQGSQLRTIATWGSLTQSKLSRLRIGIVGLGSVGSVVAESLLRMGIQQARFIDFDTIKLHNLDRTLNATMADVQAHSSKVEVARRSGLIHATAEGPVIEAITNSVVEKAGRLAALDCDLIFCCVDRPAAREVLNVLAYAHLITVIDGGIGVEFKATGALRGADWKAHTIGPGRRCLACREQYDPAMVPLDLDGTLDDPSYLSGLPKGHPLLANENVFPFSLHLAGMEVLQMLSFVVAPSGIGNPGGQYYHFASGRMEFNDVSDCDPGCYFQKMTGAGDLLSHTFPETHRYQARTK